MSPRIAPVPREQADPRAEVEFQRIESLGGYVPNIHLTFGRHAELYAAWLPFAVHIMPSSTLDPRERQLLILGTCFAWRAAYPWSHHVKISQALGALTEDEALRVSAGPEHPDWSPVESALLAACIETRRDGRIGDATWKMLAAAHDEKQLLDIVFTIGQYGLVATALESLEVELDEGFEPPAWAGSGGGAG